MDEEIASLKGSKMTRVRVSDSGVWIAYLDDRNVIRYSALFRSSYVNGRFNLEVVDKMFYDEYGMFVKRNVSIPDSIFNQMRRCAYGVFNDRVKRTKKKAAKR